MRQWTFIDYLNLNYWTTRRKTLNFHWSGEFGYWSQTMYLEEREINLVRVNPTKPMRMKLQYYRHGDKIKLDLNHLNLWPTTQTTTKSAQPSKSKRIKVSKLGEGTSRRLDVRPPTKEWEIVTHNTFVWTPQGVSTLHIKLPSKGIEIMCHMSILGTRAPTISVT